MDLCSVSLCFFDFRVKSSSEVFLNLLKSCQFLSLSVLQWFLGVFPLYHPDILNNPFKFHSPSWSSHILL